MEAIDKAASEEQKVLIVDKVGMVFNENGWQSITEDYDETAAVGMTIIITTMMTAAVGMTTTITTIMTAAADMTMTTTIIITTKEDSYVYL